MPRKITLAVTGLVLIATASMAVVAAVIGIVIPIQVTRFDRCPYCRTSLETRKVFGITTHTTIHESSFTLYYITDVDPSHRHQWEAGDYWARYTFGTRHGTIHSPPITSVNSDMLLSILRSLPTKSERKAFVYTYSNQSEFDRMFEGMPVLEKAYRADSTRKDWPSILADAGVWP